MNHKIGVFGSGTNSNKRTQKLAYELGEEIAKSKCVMITGGCGGLPHMAAMGALSKNGKTIGYSPGRNLNEHIKKYGFPTDCYNELIFVPADFKHGNKKSVAFKYRNVVSCAECDAGVIIGGRIGTLNEFTNLYDMGKIIGVLDGTGGITKMLPNIVKTANKESGAKVIYKKNPKILVNKIVRELCS